MRLQVARRPPSRPPTRNAGSGKTSLLAAALGLMHQAQGPPPRLRGTVSYVPQTAFIPAGTVRDNILFGLPFDPERYATAVRAAALVTDLQQLPAGDATELGDQGLNVSGGQKQARGQGGGQDAACDTACLPACLQGPPRANPPTTVLSALLFARGLRWRAPCTATPMSYC